MAWRVWREEPSKPRLDVTRSLTKGLDNAVKNF